LGELIESPKKSLTETAAGFEVGDGEVVRKPEQVLKKKIGIGDVFPDE
jgi:hypothetical protein